MGRQRAHTFCDKRIKHYGKRIHYKAKAYCVHTHPNTKKPYVKCYIADVNYFLGDQTKSTVEYSVKYKKWYDKHMGKIKEKTAKQRHKQG